MTASIDKFHPKMPLLTHPHPDPPLEGEGNSLSLRERGRVRGGIFIILCEPLLLMVHLNILCNCYFSCCSNKTSMRNHPVVWSYYYSKKSSSYKGYSGEPSRAGAHKG